MKLFYEHRYYAITQDISAIPCETIDDCLLMEDFLYGIEETYTNNGIQSPTAVRLFDHDNAPFHLNKNGWIMRSLHMQTSFSGTGHLRYLPAMRVEDPQGITETLITDIEGYEGLMELCRVFGYTAIAADWGGAHQHAERMERHMNLKKIFIRLKNGHAIRSTIQINNDEEYQIDLSYQNDLFQMNSCIVEGDLYVNDNYKNQEEYKTADFNTFIYTILEKFPNINLII